MEELYNLRLGGIYYPPDQITGTNVLRVPGGWIYNLAHMVDSEVMAENGYPQTKYIITSTFVPFKDERLKELLKGN